MTEKFELFAFYSNPSLLEELINVGIDGIIIDWENKGKDFRQNLYNTQVNRHNDSDLRYVRAQTNSKIICRINEQTSPNIDEINLAIELGADELLIPMIKSCEEVERVLEIVNGRVNVGLMLETQEAMTIADQLDKLPVCRYFVGLNDLAIQTNSRKIFMPMVNGLVQNIKPKLTKDFGIAGLTHPESGFPIPCSLIIKQMKLLNCSFGILRRSFYKDLSKYSMDDIISALNETFNNPINLSRKDLEITPEEKKLFESVLI